MTLLHEDHAISLGRMNRVYRPLFALPWVILVCERIAEYFEKTNWFRSSDPPGDVPYCNVQPILGAHYFGDFQTLRCQALSSEPFGVVPPGEHLPFVYYVHHAVSWMPITAGFFMLASLSLTIMVALVLRLSKESGGEFVLLLALSLPVLQALDRGNLLWIVALALIAWVVDGSHQGQRLAWIFLLSIKIQLLPTLLLLLFHARPGRAFRYGTHIVVAILSLNLIPFFIFGYGDHTALANLVTRTWRKVFRQNPVSGSPSWDLLFGGALVLLTLIPLGWLVFRQVRANFRMRVDTRPLLSGVILCTGVMAGFAFANPRYGTAIFCGVAIGLFTGSKGKQGTVSAALCVTASLISLVDGLFGRSFLMHVLVATGGVIILAAGFDTRPEEVSVGSRLRTEGAGNKRSSGRLV